jgi:hypothetical protein
MEATHLPHHLRQCTRTGNIVRGLFVSCTPRRCSDERPVTESTPANMTSMMASITVLRATRQFAGSSRKTNLAGHSFLEWR